jgi:hypothetical protein
MGFQTYGALAIVVIERAGTGCSDRCIVVISHHAVHACNIPTTTRRTPLYKLQDQTTSVRNKIFGLVMFPSLKSNIFMCLFPFIGLMLI